GSFLMARSWQPVGPDCIEIWSWVLVPAESSEEYRQLAYKSVIGTFSPSGNLEQDDVGIWTDLTRTAKSAFARSSHAKLNYQMSLHQTPLKDGHGPGTYVRTPGVAS